MEDDFIQPAAVSEMTGMSTGALGRGGRSRPVPILNGGILQFLVCVDGHSVTPFDLK